MANKEELKKLFSYVYDEKPHEFGEQFKQMVSERIAEKIEARKQDVMESLDPVKEK